MDRTKFIGGTDAAAILGLSRYKTALQVWAEKTGQVAPEDISDKLHVKLGHKLEQTVCELFTEETGKKVHRVNETLYHPKYSFIGGNIDRRVVGESAIFEAKTASAWKKAEWEGQEIPLEYEAQVMHYLMVTGAEKGYIACLIGNEKFVWKEIWRNEELIAKMLQREVSFWQDFVIPKVMPAQISCMDGDTLYQLFPQAESGSEAELGDRENAIIESLQALEQDKKAIETQIDQQKNELKAALKDKESGSTGIYRIKWQNIETKEYVCPAKKYRKLTISKRKDK